MEPEMTVRCGKGGHPAAFLRRGMADVTRKVSTSVVSCHTSPAPGRRQGGLGSEVSLAAGKLHPAAKRPRVPGAVPDILR